FQAEDGIRDLIVTGVQTCALPISSCRCPERNTDRRGRRWLCRSPHPSRGPCGDQISLRGGGPLKLRESSQDRLNSQEEKSNPPRSEERRVGKEDRSRGEQEHDRKK